MLNIKIETNPRTGKCQVDNAGCRGNPFNNMYIHWKTFLTLKLHFHKIKNLPVTFNLVCINICKTFEYLDFLIVHHTQKSDLSQQHSYVTMSNSMWVVVFRVCHHIYTRVDIRRGEAKVAKWGHAPPPPPTFAKAASPLGYRSRLV